MGRSLARSLQITRIARSWSPVKRKGNSRRMWASMAGVDGQVSAPADGRASRRRRGERDLQDEELLVDEASLRLQPLRDDLGKMNLPERLSTGGWWRLSQHAFGKLPRTMSWRDLLSAWRMFSRRSLRRKFSVNG